MLETREAFVQSQAQAAAQAEFYTTVLWILFALFVIAPLLYATVAVFLILSKARKCPNCGSYRAKPAMYAVEKDDIITTEDKLLCLRCKQVH